MDNNPEPELWHAKLNDYLVIDSAADITIVRDASILTAVDTDVSLYEVTVANSTSMNLSAKGLLNLTWMDGRSSQLKALVSSDAGYDLLSYYYLYEIGIRMDPHTNCLIDLDENTLAPYIRLGKYLCISTNFISRYLFHGNQIGSKLPMSFVHSPFGYINI